MSLGLRRGTVKLEPHDLRWEEEAGKAIEMIKSILGEDAVDIQHVGSTAISAISAKPIVDIVVGVKELSRILQCQQLKKELESRFSDDRDAYTKGKHALSIDILEQACWWKVVV